MIDKEIRNAMNHIFAKPQAFADVLNCFDYKEKQITPDMIKDCSQELFSIIDEEMHFSSRLTVTKIVNDGFGEEVVTIEMIPGEGNIILWSHPNNFIH